MSFFMIIVFNGMCFPEFRRKVALLELLRKTLWTEVK